jgi:dTDP-glucose pyrophosphorylase
MERLNDLEASHQFQIVIDENARVLGTVTDGDVRRSILNGISLTDPITKGMNSQPMLGRVDDDVRNLAILRGLVARIAFLPVIDRDQKLREVLVLAGRIDQLAALVMAGGFGRRLGERTKTTPKPLLELQGKPILEHIFDRLEAADVSQIYISTHYLADQIERFVDGRKSSAAIDTLYEEKPLGTAGAVGLLPLDLKTAFIVANGDVLTNVDLAALVDFHVKHANDATIAVAQHHVTIPFGVIRHTDDGRFRDIDEKPILSHFVAAGIYLLSPEFRTLVRAGEHLDMPELLTRGRDAGLSIGLFPIHEYWTDIGQPKDLDRAFVDFPSGKV